MAIDNDLLETFTFLLLETSQTHHLIHFVPLGVERLLNGLAVEQLVADLQDTIRVRFSHDQPSQELVFALQILSLQEVNPQDPLGGHAEEDIQGSSSKKKKKHLITLFGPQSSRC